MYAKLNVPVKEAEIHRLEAKYDKPYEDTLERHNVESAKEGHAAEYEWAPAVSNPHSSYCALFIVAGSSLAVSPEIWSPSGDRQSGRNSHGQQLSSPF